ncbi:MAG: SPOR domain-containing protein [Tannerella sp.]|nr:SPOR domain-containing protein [Tannerella sp.]
MLRISTHIEQLLLVNDCVIIPDLGGFVLQSHPAVYAVEEHLFYPPRKEIVFNPALRHNDGLLSESYMQFYGMDFKDAQRSLKKDIEDLKTELERKGGVSLGAVGSFQKGKEGKSLFQPCADPSVFSIEAYGLEMFHLPPYQMTGEKRMTATKIKHTTGRVFYLPVHRAIVHGTGLAAASVALFLLISTPVKEVDRTAYTAGFTLSEIVPQPASTVEQPVPVASPLSEEISLTPSPPAPPVVSETAPPSVAAAPSLQQPAVPVQPQKTYYVIIGSFRTEKQAEQFRTELSVSDCKETGIVTQDKNIRVYAARYGRREEAEAYLSRLRTNGKFKNAWLFAGR